MESFRKDGEMSSLCSVLCSIFFPVEMVSNSGQVPSYW